jgi:hypothetical protein
MAEAGQRLRLAFEPLLPLRVGGNILGQDLDGDGAVKPCISRLVDLSHAARADLGVDLVRTEACAGSQSHAIRPEL